MKCQLLSVLLVAFGIAASPQVLAQPVDYEAAKGIIERTLAGEPTGQQAMDVSVLVYSPQGGNPIQRAAHQSFFTGERFKLKIRASQSGTLQVVNVEQSGKENRLSPAALSAGVETLYPADPGKFLEFDNNSGNEILRLSLVTAGAPVPTSGSSMACPPACPVGNSYAPPVQACPAGYQAGAGGCVPSPCIPGACGSASASSAASALYGNATGKAYVTGKGIKEVILESAAGPNGGGRTQIIQPLNGGGLSYEMQIRHY